MEKNSFWVLNSVYSDLKEFHFSSLDFNFVAYYKNDKLTFVLDNTCNFISPNNLLLIEPYGEDKWDNILKNKFKIDPMKIRPKENTKYKKLDISYISLKIFEDFIKFQTDYLYNAISCLREDISLKSAFMRESENLLVYNKACKTLESSPETLEKLKKKILNLSLKIQKNQKAENENGKVFDEEIKNQLIQKLYDNTEKLKNTERRIKRANKRQENSKKELIKIREHIKKLKQKITERKTEDNGKIKDLTCEKQELLTVENLNARNQREEKENIKQKEFLEENMVKDTDKKVETVTEFKPPVADVVKADNSKFATLLKKVKAVFIGFKSKKTLSNSSVVSESKVDKKTLNLKNLFSDASKNKAVLKYFLLFIIVLLIVVMGIFVFSDTSKNNNFTEKNRMVEVLDNNIYENEEKQEDENVREYETVEKEENIDFQNIEKENFDDNTNKEVPVTQVQEDKNGMIVLDEEKEEVQQNEELQQPILEAKEEDVVQVKKEIEPVVNKVSNKQNTSVKTAKLVKTEKVDDLKKEKFERKIVVTNENIQEKDDDFEENKDKDKNTNSFKLSELDIVRKDYIDIVLSGDKYLNLFNDIKNNFFVSEEKVDFRVLYEMNQIWNKFRNLSYNEYYNEDETLKSDINEKEYNNDEYLLRLYVNAYNDMFENIMNDFVGKYEYANGTAVDLYDRIENSLNTLGKPVEKFIILEEIYNRVKNLGGSETILESIVKKEEMKSVQNGENVEEVKLETVNIIDVRSDDNVMDIDEEKKNTEIDKDMLVENVDSVPVSVIDESYIQEGVSENINKEDVNDVENKTEVVEEKDSDMSENIDRIEDLKEDEVVDSSKESEVIEYIGEEETD